MASEPIEPQSPEQCALLRERLAESRQQTAEAVSRLAAFRSMVRSTVTEYIREGLIVWPDVNETLERWGEEPYKPRYNVRLRFDMVLTVDADNEADARTHAYEGVTADPVPYESHVENIVVPDAEEVDG